MKRLLGMFLLALAGCEQPPDAAHGRVAVPPRTVAPSIVAVLSVSPLPDVGFRISAPEDRALYLDNCNGAISWGLEHEQAHTWVPAWTAEINGCHSQPIEIAAGTAREFVEVFRPRPGDALPPPPYRLAVYGLYFTHESSDHAANVEVPHALRLSQPFTPATSLAP